MIVSMITPNITDVSTGSLITLKQIRITAIGIIATMKLGRSSSSAPSSSSGARALGAMVYRMLSLSDIKSPYKKK